MEENTELLNGNETVVDAPQIDEAARSQAELNNFAFGVPIPQELLTEEELAGQEPSIGNDTLTSVATAQEAAPPPSPIDSFLSELGYQNQEDFKSEYARLKQLSEAPPQQVAPEYPDEYSKLVASYILEGKEAELFSVLEKRKMVAGVESMTDEDKLKTYLKLKNPKFDSELISDEFDSLYKVDENDSSLFDTYGELDQLKLRKAKLRTAQRIEDDIQRANEYFEEYKKQIQLHPIKSPVDDDYQAYKASMQQANDNYNNDVVPSIKNLTAEALAMSVSLEDVDSQISATVSIKPSAEDLQKAKDTVLNVTGFLNSFYDGGKLKANEITQFFLKGLLFDKYVQSGIRQAINADRKSTVTAQSTPDLPSKHLQNGDANSHLQQLNDFAFRQFGL